MILMNLRFNTEAREPGSVPIYPTQETLPKKEVALGGLLTGAGVGLVRGVRGYATVGKLKGTALLTKSLYNATRVSIGTFVCSLVHIVYYLLLPSCLFHFHFSVVPRYIMSVLLLPSFLFTLGTSLCSSLLALVLTQRRYQP